MKFKEYLKDRLYALLLISFLYLLLLLLFLAFKSNLQLIIACFVLLTITFILLLLYDFFRKRKFYNDLIFKVGNLDKAYLVLEMIDKPRFYEGELFCQILYDIDKSMIERVSNFEGQMNDFKEFIEMWIHEVKIPLSSLTLMAHNHKDKYDKKSLLQMKRIENYVEQVLYYVRQDCAEADYLINKINLSKVISNVILKNKDELLENKIELLVEVKEKEVFSDSKWLEFIINQIFNNCIKYKKEKNSFIKIQSLEDENSVYLIIEDNGIGIKKSDLSRVFDKSFTGSNGRYSSRSTGMGLYICKNLCKKLGHKIEIDSIQDEFTRVRITFSKNNFYEEALNVTKK